MDVWDTLTVFRCFLEMGFPINYLLQLLQSVTYHFLPVHGLEGKCTFPIVLFKVCQKQQQLKPADNTTNNSMDNNGNTHPTYVLPPSTPYCLSFY